MHGVQAALLPFRPLEDAHAHSHGREAARVSQVREAVCQERRVQEAREDPRQGEGDEGQGKGGEQGEEETQAASELEFSCDYVELILGRTVKIY